MENKVEIPPAERPAVLQGRKVRVAFCFGGLRYEGIILQVRGLHVIVKGTQCDMNGRPIALSFLFSAKTALSGEVWLADEN